MIHLFGRSPYASFAQRALGYNLRRVTADDLRTQAAASPTLQVCAAARGDDVWGDRASRRWRVHVCRPHLALLLPPVVGEGRLLGRYLPLLTVNYRYLP